MVRDCEMPYLNRLQADYRQSRDLEFLNFHSQLTQIYLFNINTIFFSIEKGIRHNGWEWSTNLQSVYRFDIPPTSQTNQGSGSRTQCR